MLATGVGAQGELDAGVIDQQGIGAGVVRPQRVVVECRRVVRRQGKGAAIEDDVPVDFAYAAGAQFAQQQPDLLLQQAGVTTAAQVEVARQNAAIGRRRSQRLGFPGVCGAEQFERGIRCDQFHRRGRVERLLRVMANERRGRVDRLDKNPHVVQRDVGVFQRLADARW